MYGHTNERLCYLTFSMNIWTCNLGGFKVTACLTTFSKAAAVVARRDARFTSPSVFGSEAITFSGAATDACSTTTVDLLSRSPERILSPVTRPLLSHIGTVDVDGDRELCKGKTEEERCLGAASNLVAAIVLKVQNQRARGMKFVWRVIRCFIAM